MKRHTGMSAFTVLAAGCLLLMLSGLSSAFDGEGRQGRQIMSQEIGAACGESLAALCADVWGPGRIRCLLDRYEETSPECQAVLDRIEQRRADQRERRRTRVATVCGESLKNLCPGVYGPDCVGCLMDHYDQASPECQALLDDLRSQRRAGRGPMSF